MDYLYISEDERNHIKREQLAKLEREHYILSLDKKAAPPSDHPGLDTKMNAIEAKVKKLRG